MIASIDRPTMVIGSVFGTAMVGGISGENIATISMVAAFVGGVVLGFAWLDARMDFKIKTHTSDDEKLAKARNAQMLAEIRAILAEHDLKERREE